MGGQSKETKKRQDFRGGKKEVKKFYLRGDISNELPSKKDVLKLKDKDRKVTIIQKHLMAITLQEAHKVFTEENPDMKIGFTSFRKLKPPQVKRVSEKNRWSCLCKTCCNVLESPTSHKQALSSPGCGYQKPYVQGNCKTDAIQG